MTFRPGDVVRVPFPYTNRQTHQHRPALVVSAPDLAGGMLLWVLMITSAENRSWPGDIDLGPEGSADAGLPAHSVVRASKIATIEASMASGIGAISVDCLARVRRQVQAILAL